MTPCADGFRIHAGAVACAAAIMVGFAAVPAHAGKDAQPFRPLTAEERLMVKSSLDPDADAEILDWDVRIEDHLLGFGWESERWQYLRVKILTERGRDRWTRIELPSNVLGFKLKKLEGRTLQPDGSEVRLESDEMHERTLIQSGGQRIKVRSFVMPAVQVGSVIETRCRYVTSSGMTHYSQLPLWYEEGTPVRRVGYHIKPARHVFLPSMRSFYRNCKPVWTHDPDGFFSFTATDLRSFRREPDMPSDDEVLPWILVYYGENPEVSAYWKNLGNRYHDLNKEWFKVTDKVRSAAHEIVGTATSDDARLRALYDHCHRKLRNLGSTSSDTTIEPDEQQVADRSPSDVLKDRIGHPHEINRTFGALAHALGYEVRVVHMGRRDKMTLDPQWPDNYFLTRRAVAIQTSDGWRLFDPATEYLPCNMLEDVEEGQTAFLPGPEPGFILIPASPPEASPVMRTGTFTLAEDGTLEGDVTIESRGHLAMALKQEIGSLSTADQVRHIESNFRERVGDAELTEVRIVDAKDPDRPLIARFHVRMPGYAQATGKRLLLQPAVFQKRIKPRYSETNRRFAIQYLSTWSEFDSVTLKLPAGFEIEKAGNATSHDFTAIARYEMYLDELVGQHAVRMQRRFSMAKLRFSRDDYPALKSDFDHLHRQDATVLVLVRSGSAP